MIDKTQKLMDISRENLLQIINDFGSDDIKSFGGTHQGGIHLQQYPPEFADLLEFLFKIDEQNPLKNYLEVGSAAGGTAHALNHFLRFDKLTLVDNNEHPKHKLRKETLKGIERTEIIGNSQIKKIFDKVSKLNLTYDLAMLDADHSYEGIRKDFELYSPLVKPGGLVIFHDIADDERLHLQGCFVDVFWKDLKTKSLGDYHEFGGNPGPGIGVLVLNKN
jgi:predicted O-methyltransferase YrrM